MSIGLLQRLEYGEAKVDRFFVAPTVMMDIINRDRICAAARGCCNGAGCNDWRSLSDRKCTFHPIKHIASLSGLSIVDLLAR